MRISDWSSDVCSADLVRSTRRWVDGASLRRGLRRGITIVPSGRIGMTYRLYYWPGIQGRGEFVRLALEEAGVAYVDVGMDEAEGGLETVQALLDAHGAVHTPFATPVLGNGKTVRAQVGAITHKLGPR